MDVEGNSDSRQRARQLRRELTKPERLLWWALRGNRTGLHFRRQHPAETYVLDFYCDAARLCVEVDGGAHDFTAIRDERRDAHLRRLGVATIRVSAGDVLTNLDGVVAYIAAEAGKRPLRRPLADTSPKGEGLSRA